VISETNNHSLTKYHPVSTSRLINHTNLHLEIRGNSSQMLSYRSYTSAVTHSMFVYRVPCRSHSIYYEECSNILRNVYNFHLFDMVLPATDFAVNSIIIIKAKILAHIPASSSISN